jgi:hypothetical protein
MREDTDNMTNTPEMIFTLLVYFLGLGLCFWRWPQGDGRHVVNCLLAASLWGGLLLLVPATRVAPFAINATFLAIALSRPFQPAWRSRTDEK